MSFTRSPSAKTNKAHFSEWVQSLFGKHGIQSVLEELSHTGLGQC